LNISFRWLSFAALGAAALAVAPYVIPPRQKRRFAHEELSSPDDRFVDVDGFRMRYQVKGEGTPIILIHGFASSVVTWYRNMDDLARDHRVYAIDLKGWGLSDKPSEGDYSLLAQAHHVRSFMRAVGIERAVIAGHSMGGTVAVNFAVEYPEAALGIVLVDPAGARRFPYLWLMSSAMEVPWLRRWAKVGMEYAMTNESLITSGMPRAYHDAQNLTPWLKRALWAPMNTHGFEDAFLNLTRDARHSHVHGRAHLVQCPTLILWGEGDMVVSPADAQFFLAHIANSRLVLLENAGHLPHEERAEDVNRLIQEFVAELET
jgi:pimeloyl-ACP methyl ester carboxylesterase